MSDGNGSNLTTGNAKVAATVFGLLLAIASPLVAVGILVGQIDRAKDDIIRNADSDARQWQEIVKTKVLTARLDERSKCK